MSTSTVPLSSSSPSSIPDAAALGGIVNDFRDRYAVATDEAADRLDEDWDVMWSYATRGAVQDLLLPDADVSAVRGRLAALLRRWRHSMLDPVGLYARSLHVQEVVLTGKARIEAWCDENRCGDAVAVAVDTETDDGGGGGYSAEWCTMLAHPTDFDGYDLTEDYGNAPPTTAAAAFGFRPPFNLYGSRGYAYPRRRRGRERHYDPLDAVDRHTLLLAAVGEMQRYDDPYYQQQQYVRRCIIGLRGCYVDAESVARDRCGYPDFFRCRDLFDHSYAEWRRPIAHTERIVRRMILQMQMQQHPQHFSLPHLLKDWLCRHAGCGPEYVGVRYPPAFGALIADVFGETIGDFGTVVPEHRWDADAAERSVRIGATVDPQQVYGRWLRYGFLRPPGPAVLTRSWSTVDRLALAERGGRFTAEFRADWERNNNNNN